MGGISASGIDASMAFSVDRVNGRFNTNSKGNVIKTFNLSATVGTSIGPDVPGDINISGAASYTTVRRLVDFREVKKLIMQYLPTRTGSY